MGSPFHKTSSADLKDKATNSMHSIDLEAAGGK